MKSKEEIQVIINCIKSEEYNYSCEFEGNVSSCTAENSENGLIYRVYLYAETPDFKAYANHSIIIGNDTINCYEFLISPKKWYLNGEEFDFSPYEELYVLINNIIEPFDFAKYAISNFEWDALVESIPYGDPYCLIADGCIFMVEEGGENFTDQDVREFLKYYNWSNERIDKVIKDGYELTDDVWECLENVPIIFDPYEY